MANSSIENTTGPLLHIVLFWLKEPNNKAHRDEFETALKKLITTNPQAISNHLGIPANTEKRSNRQLFYLLLHYEFSRYRSTE